METEDRRIPTKAEIYQAIAKGELPQGGLVNETNEINFSGNTILNIGEPRYGGKWFLSSTGKLSYEGYKYQGTTWTTPTEEGQITEDMIVANGNYNETAGVNTPKLAEGMIPIYYDGTNWRKANATNELADLENPNSKWYEYTESKRQYANICTVSDINASYRTAALNTVIPIGDMTTMFVWIPRYAYSINEGSYRVSNAEEVWDTNRVGTKKITVKFLVGTLSQDSTGTTYGRDYNADSIAVREATPYIVHPGFTFGGKELPGLWIAKFETSGKNSEGQYVGNSDGTADKQKYSADISTYVQILPGAISWRYTNQGECQYRSMQMGSNKAAYGWYNVNTHLIKNSEWGAAAYLSYSQYGRVPMINGASILDNTGSYYYNCYTGAGPDSDTSELRYENYTGETKGYNTDIGQLASTTGNVYGIYDMSGGAWERVAAYLDNKNSNLTNYGKSTSNPSIIYFIEEELNPIYADYWDRYEVSLEERNNLIYIKEIVEEGKPAIHLTQTELFDANKIAKEYNEARLRLVEYIFNNMQKGIGIKETTEVFSYYGAYNNGTKNTWNWFTDLIQPYNKKSVSRKGLE